MLAFFLEKASIKPNAIAIDSIEEPPYEIKGNVIPLAGIIPKLTPIFIPDCIPIIDDNPAIDSLEKIS